MKCFYHSADLDGHCSGAIVKYRFPECEMIGINYGDPFPWEKIEPRDMVYMVDFTLQPEILMKNLVEHALEVYWIDHHKSSIEAVPKTIKKHLLGIQDTSKAACELTWEYLFPDRPVPLSVKLLSLYDSWMYQGHELEDMVLPFQMRMKMENLDPKDWDSNHKQWKILLNHPGYDLVDNLTIKPLVEQGRLLLRYDQSQKDAYAKRYGFETEVSIPPRKEISSSGLILPPIRRLRAIAVNLGMTNSLVFDSVWRRECKRCEGTGGSEEEAGSEGYVCPFCNGAGYTEPYDLMIAFCRRPDKQWTVSLYSTKTDIDCGAIAKSFGGGGHKGAAGFQCKDLPFEY